jgi:hypothetical protein
MAAQLAVFGLVPHTHAATTELFQDAVVSDGLADRQFIFRAATRRFNSSNRS